MKLRRLKLTPEMEKALLAGLLFGAVSPETVNPDELSEPARKVHRVISDLLVGGATPPLHIPAVLLALTEVHGVPLAQAQAYLDNIRAMVSAADGAEATLRLLREKHSLLQVANEAMAQLQKGEFSSDRLSAAMAGGGVSKAPTPLAAELEHGFPPPPPRLPLRSLPRFSERIGGGFVGLSIVAGEPAIGKSRVVWQAALDVGLQGTNVVYYDLDNGISTLVDRTRLMFEGDRDRIIEATRNIYLRDSIHTLDSDLVYIPPPALVVVDIFQALPVSQEFERQGLGRWIHRLGGLRRRGYHVLVVSEVSRGFYGNAGLGAFKGSGEIEYTADLGMQMVPAGDGASIVVVKNRHGAFKGEVVTLTSERGVLWREVSDDFPTE